MFSTKVIISKAEIESSYGHVHHAQTLRFLELARLRFLDFLGYPNQGFIDQGLLTVVSCIQISFLRELFEGEIEVTCSSGRFDGKKLFLEQQILNSRKKLAVRALIELQFLSRLRGRSTEAPPEFREALQEFFAGANSVTVHGP